MDITLNAIIHVGIRGNLRDQGTGIPGYQEKIRDQGTGVPGYQDYIRDQGTGTRVDKSQNQQNEIGNS